MKKQFKNSVLFLIILLSIFIVIEWYLATVKNSYILKRSCLEKDPKEIEMIVLGSSQVYYDIDPERFSKYSCNLANSNQDFYYDSQILAKHLNQLKNLKYAVIGVAYFSFEFDLNNTEEYWRKYFYKRFWDIPPQKETWDLRSYSLIAAYQPENVRKIILPFYRMDLTVNNTNTGWFKAPKNTEVKEDAGFKRANIHKGYMKESLTLKNKQLLEGMIEDLQKRGVKVILVTPPVSKDYFTAIDSGKYQRMQDAISQITEKYQVKYLNYFRDERFKKEDFTDGSDHLDQESANRFSQILLQSI